MSQDDNQALKDDQNMKKMWNDVLEVLEASRQQVVATTIKLNSNLPTDEAANSLKNLTEVLGISQKLIRLAAIKAPSLADLDSEDLYVLSKVLHLARNAPSSHENERGRWVGSMRMRSIDWPSTVNIRILEEPLTSHNLAVIISTLTDLHTKCWLISQGRFTDLISYTQTRNLRFIEEANLVITKITYNSPANFNFDVSPQSVAEALGTGIDAIAQTPYRFKVAKLESQLKELEVRKQEIENQSSREDRDQARQIEAQKAEIERQKALVEIEKQKVELAKQQVDLQKARLELEQSRMDYAIETARKMVDILQPSADDQTKAMLIQTVLPNLMQLGEGKGLVLSLSTPKPDTNDQDDLQKS